MGGLLKPHGGVSRRGRDFTEIEEIEEVKEVEDGQDGRG